MRRVYPVLLFITVMLVFMQAVGFEVLGLDDVSYTFGNHFVSTGLSWGNVREAFSNFTRNGIWMPVANVTYMADFSLAGGGNPFPVLHATSVAFHCLDAVLLYYLILGLMRPNGDRRANLDYPLAFAAAALWALHPLRAESVAWVASRKDTVLAFFTLLGILAWRRAVLQGRHSHIVLANVCAILACMSKPTGMAFPALALSVEILAAGMPRGRRLLKYLPLLAVGVATGMLAMYSQHNPEGGGWTASGASFSWRLLNGAVALGLYLWQTAVPVGIHPACRPMYGGLPEGVVPGIATLVAAVVAFATAVWMTAKAPGRAGRALAASAIWFLASVAPTLGIFGTFGMQSRADRFTYLPAMGLSLALACLLSNVMRKMWARVALAVAVIAVAICGARQIRFFRNDEAFFGRVVQCDPEDAFAWTKLGEKHLKDGDIEKGIGCFRSAYAAEPNDTNAGLLAYVLSRRGDQADFGEIKDLCAGLAGNPGLDERGHATQALGAVAFAEGRFADAVRYYGAAEKVFPPSEELEMRLAASHFNAGNLAEAERRFRRILRTADGEAKEYARQALRQIFQRRQWEAARGGRRE